MLLPLSFSSIFFIYILIYIPIDPGVLEVDVRTSLYTTKMSNFAFSGNEIPRIMHIRVSV